jgi:hypothetical protein
VSKDPSRHVPELDPDFFNVLLQALSVLSNVATMASGWGVLRRDVDRHRNDRDNDALRAQLRALHRNLEDTFEAVEAILMMLDAASQRAGQGGLLSQPPKFGTAVMLTVDEFNNFHQHLNQLGIVAMNARQNTVFHTDLATKANIQFDVEGFNRDLNSILFDSRDLAEAMTKPRGVQRQAEDLVNDVERGLRRN